MAQTQQAVLAAVAVLEPHATVGRVAEVAGLPLALTRSAVGDLVACGRLAPDGPLRFVDEQDRQATYDDLPAPVRASLHAAAADLLRDQHHAPADLARHVLLAEPAGRQDRVDVLREAARIACVEQRMPDAVTYLRRAIDEPAGHNGRRCSSRWDGRNCLCRPRKG